MGKDQRVLERLQNIIERLERANEDFTCSNCLTALQSLKDLHDDIGQGQI